METIEFRMPSRRDAVSGAVDAIVAAATPAGLTEDQLQDLAVAAAEALSNAAVHGNRLAADHDVHVSIRLRRGHSAVIDVRDHGPGFDASTVKDPTTPEQMLVPGGRGVFLMRRLVDRLSYNRSGNRVRLTVSHDHVLRPRSRR